MSRIHQTLEALRQRAERALGSGEAALHRLDTQSALDVSSLLHELRVYHAELEIQNSELIASQQSEECVRKRYQTLFNLLPLPAFLIDNRGVIEETNAIAVSTFGFRSVQHMLQHSLTRLVDKDHAQTLRQLLYDTTSEKTASGVRVNFMTPSGRTLPMEVYLQALPSSFHLESRHLVICVDQSPQQNLANLQQLLDAIVNNSSALIYAYDLDGRCLLANNALCALVGRPSGSLTGLMREDFLNAEDAAAHSLNDQQVLTSRTPLIYEEKLHKPGTDVRYYHSQKFPLYDADAELAGVAGITIDITDSRNKEIQLSIAAHVYQAGSEGIVITDDQQRIQSVNAAFTQITGFSEQDVLGEKPSILASGRHPEAFYNAMWTSLNTSGTWAGEIWNRRKNGEIYPEWLSISRVASANEETANYIGVFSDITLRKAAEDEIHRLAFYDALTGLPNRHLLIDRAEQALRKAERDHAIYAVLFLDLDRFKTINDVFGHAAGDYVLREVTQRMRQTVRDNDTISRLGGDEFVLLIEGLDGTALERRAQALVRTLAEPIAFENAELLVSASVGIALYPEDGRCFADLLKNADIAMYEAKASGRNGWCFFNKQMAQVASERIEVEYALRKALENQELSLRFQPQIELTTGRICGVEALIRWQRNNDFISPDVFIPIAEETGLIIELGRFVLDKAINARKNWLAQGFDKFVIAINVSYIQFWRDDFVAEIEQALARHSLPGQLLEIELTERIAITNPRQTVEKMQALKALGVRLSIDDFGTGYSSLSYLNIMPIDALKIDKAFIRDIGLDDRDEAVCRTIIQLAQAIEVATIAEGVETSAQLDFLRSNQCTIGQGYFFAHPLFEQDVDEQLMKLGDTTPSRQ